MALQKSTFFFERILYIFSQEFYLKRKGVACQLLLLTSLTYMCLLQRYNQLIQEIESYNSLIKCTDAQVSATYTLMEKLSNRPLANGRKIDEAENKIRTLKNEIAGESRWLFTCIGAFWLSLFTHTLVPQQQMALQSHFLVQWTFHFAKVTKLFNTPSTLRNVTKIYWNSLSLS